MYTIHRTECYVIKSADNGEANRRIDLLTKELGLIRGTAQGVRYLKSKLRYSLNDLAYVNVALVRGKDIWRIVNASKYDDIFFDLPYSYRTIFLKVFSLIGRLITGEFSEPHIFSLIRGAHIFANENLDLTQEELNGFECLIILQLLHYLGYVGSGTILDIYSGQNFSKPLVQQANEEKREIISIINQALSHSGL